MSSYLDRIREAISAADKEDGCPAQNLIAHLSGYGLVIVEVPAGIKHNFVGIEEVNGVG